MNAQVKGEGGAVGLTENPAALRRWIIAGPEVVRIIQKFEETSAKEDFASWLQLLHYLQTLSQLTYLKLIRMKFSTETLPMLIEYSHFFYNKFNKILNKHAPFKTLSKRRIKQLPNRG